MGPLRRATYDNRASNLESTIQFCVIVSYARRLVKAFLENAMTKSRKIGRLVPNAGEISCFNVRARATGGRPYGENRNRLLGSFGFCGDSIDSAGYGKHFSLIGETVCLPDVFSRDAKIPLLLYVR